MVGGGVIDREDSISPDNDTWVRGKVGFRSDWKVCSKGRLCCQLEDCRQFFHWHSWTQSPDQQGTPCLWQKHACQWGHGCHSQVWKFPQNWVGQILIQMEQILNKNNERQHHILFQDIHNIHNWIKHTYLNKIIQLYEALDLLYILCSNTTFAN